ncbi:MAG: ATP-binding protein [Bacteroidales bacterium]|nr:ATP-binding protein [Bacteroidales bacterium]
MIRTAILQQKEERDALLQRKYQDRVLLGEMGDMLASNLIKLITGPRRAGKSVFALQLLKSENFAYLNFDDDLLLKHFDENALIQLLLEVYPNFEYLLLDEIQNLPNWELWVAKLYRRGINLIITGSNSKLLSNEMATALTGRFIQITILPFSYAEVLAFNDVPISYETPAEKALLLQQLTEILTCGSFPETIKSRSLTRNYLSALYDSILLKDLTRRFNVRNSNELYSLSTYLLANYCNPFSVNQLTNELSIGSAHTVQKFCKYLSEPYLFFYLSRYNNKLKLMKKAPQKAFVVDNGFVAAQSFELSENKGRLLENLVFVDLIRRGYNTQQTLFYYRTRNDKEIDFVCRNMHNVETLIQVSYDLQNPKTCKREISSLIEASGELKCTNLLLLTWDDERTVKEAGVSITVKPVWKWLLDI